MLDANEDGVAGDQRRMRLGQAAAELYVTHLEFKCVPKAGRSSEMQAQSALRLSGPKIHRPLLSGSTLPLT